MKSLLRDIRACRHCEAHLPSGPRPIVQAGRSCKILIVGQAPGRKVHESGIPWDDASGDRLRLWMGIDKTIFYDDSVIALVPMGFCYPGKGSSGDLPPRPECAPLWHARLLKAMPTIQLTLLIGTYAQNYYLGDRAADVTTTVKNYKKYLPEYWPLVHPSPRNQIWAKKNPWFERDVVPHLQKIVRRILKN
jgi:uracil-DNA glycosylase